MTNSDDDDHSANPKNSHSTLTTTTKHIKVEKGSKFKHFLSHDIHHLLPPSSSPSTSSSSEETSQIMTIFANDDDDHPMNLMNHPQHRLPKESRSFDDENGSSMIRSSVNHHDPIMKVNHDDKSNNNNKNTSSIDHHFTSAAREGFSAHNETILSPETLLSSSFWERLRSINDDDDDKDSHSFDRNHIHDDDEIHHDEYEEGLVEHLRTMKEQKSSNDLDESKEQELYEPLFPHVENPFYCQMASRLFMLEKYRLQQNNMLLDPHEQHATQEETIFLKSLHMHDDHFEHLLENDSFDDSTRTTSATNTEREHLEILALEIIKCDALLKLRMDVAKERREKSRRIRSFQYLLVSKMDVYLMDVCVLLYDVLKLHQFEEKLRDENTLLENVQNAMIHVFFNLGELCYFIWEEEKSSICFKRCEKLLNQKKEKAGGILSDQDCALVVECLIYGMVDSLNNNSGNSTLGMETKFVKPMQEYLSKFCNVEHMDELMSSKNIRCDMNTIAKCILRTRVNCMESLVNYKYGDSSDMEKYVKKAINFVNIQSTFDRTHLELQQYFDMDEFYCRLGAICTGRVELFNAITNFNNSLKIRRRFYIRTLVNKYIAINNQSMESVLLLTLAVYYNLLAQLECSKFKKLTERQWNADPFHFLKYTLMSSVFEAEKVFEQEIRDPLNFIQQQDWEEHTVRKWLWNIEKLLHQKKEQDVIYKELIENELVLIDKLNEIAREEAYVALSIPKLIQNHFVDLYIKTH
ncbi:hypothetical protein FDP41_008774 [Naegleria fowleri]|uniref:Uncharacterized protein n=1 Tax=Naegleria fowleri TaxID=5763 RepID=A0A6A5BDL2_NAEFO|nr:uncharacterized protein FDP41_008774 [Naegleria fowleri]KAF0972922.1 hypothetical protein FDP41_008774 [Naegleria fowleri]CAG4716712.1 unnamed protein product [Naegleria fowleri]